MRKMERPAVRTGGPPRASNRLLASNEARISGQATSVDDRAPADGPPLRRRRPVFVLRLQPLHDADDIRRLRALLKALLRRLELRCLSIEEEK